MGRYRSRGIGKWVDTGGGRLGRREIGEEGHSRREKQRRKDTKKETRGEGNIEAGK